MINTNKIIVASTPRTGSMWTYNIIREIIKLYKYKLVPEIIPQSDNDMMDIQKKDYKNLNIISVIKVHQLVKIENLNNTKLIFNFRDPRDALVSYLRFMKIDKYELINKINFIKNIIRRIEYYRNSLNKDNYLEINYKQITKKPENIIDRIGIFLNLNIQKNQIIKINNKYQKKKLKEQIKIKDKELEFKKKNKKINKNEVVYLGKNNFRFFDKYTGFQSGHISSHKDGQWKDFLSNEEIIKINSTFNDWLKKNNLKNS